MTKSSIFFLFYFSYSLFYDIKMVKKLLLYYSPNVCLKKGNLLYFMFI